ncbi:glutathione transferase GstA [Orbaceae bacterium ESL0721]|nr:glutathione transferase GstA [Orbaceae bacterium ESL0721]
MKLYYTAGACSLNSHILLCETGIPFTTEAVDLKNKKTASGKNFLDITVRGQVPTLQFDDGSVLTENIAIAQYIADKAPEKKLLAPVGEMQRYQTIAWFNYIATEVHKLFGAIFFPVSEIAAEAAINNLLNKFSYIDSVLAKTPYISGDHFTIADAYLFVVSRWSKMIPNLPSYPAFEQFIERVKNRPAVKAAIAQEEGDNI